MARKLTITENEKYNTLGREIRRGKLKKLENIEMSTVGIGNEDERRYAQRQDVEDPIRPHERDRPTRQAFQVRRVTDAGPAGPMPEPEPFPGAHLGSPQR